jgi:hypothetical protein
VSVSLIARVQSDGKSGAAAQRLPGKRETEEGNDSSTLYSLCLNDYCSNQVCSAPRKAAGVKGEEEHWLVAVTFKGVEVGAVCTFARLMVMTAPSPHQWTSRRYAHAHGGPGGKRPLQGAVCCTPRRRHVSRAQRRRHQALRRHGLRVRDWDVGCNAAREGLDVGCNAVMRFRVQDPGFRTQGSGSQ